jgi:signal transduction histidine kinase
MRRLYFRIYLAVLGSLALFGLLVFLSGFVFRELHEPGNTEPQTPFLPEAVAHLLPANASVEALNKELQFWHNRMKLDLALISSAGEVIAQAGPVPPDTLAVFTKTGSHSPPRRGPHGAFAIELGEGRKLIAVRMDRGFGFLFPLRGLLLLFAIGLAVAICAYPIVRRLTRSLELLQKGVAAFGEGNLKARVAVRGRDETAKLAETFNASADRIEALVKAQKTLLANASHELRSPLARLRMAAEAIGPQARQREREEIARNIEELDALVEEILLASRLDAGVGLAGGFSQVDLVGLLAEECTAFGADLSVPAGQPVIVEGDRRLLRRLFRNLLENARRYGGHGPVDVSVSRHATLAVIGVCDRGPGIAEEERERIFEPFYRPKGHAQGDGGTGLGLSLVRQIARKHGGEVQYVHGEGTGACFEVTLPLHPVET